MLKETSQSCREASGSMRQAEWKMTPARSSGAVASGLEPRPRIAKETSEKCRETQSSKVMREQILTFGFKGRSLKVFSQFACIYLPGMLQPDTWGRAVARHQDAHPGHGAQLLLWQLEPSATSCAYKNDYGVGMDMAPCSYSLRLVFQVISSFTSYGLILKGFSVIGLSLAMFNPLIFSTCISLLRGKANSGWQWKRDHIQAVIVSMSKTKA